MGQNLQQMVQICQLCRVVWLPLKTCPLNLDASNQRPQQLLCPAVCRRAMRYLGILSVSLANNSFIYYSLTWREDVLKLARFYEFSPWRRYILGSGGRNLKLGHLMVTSCIHNRHWKISEIIHILWLVTQKGPTVKHSLIGLSHSEQKIYWLFLWKLEFWY